MNLELRHKIVLEIIISVFLLIWYSSLYLNTDSLVELTLFSSVYAAILFPKAILLSTAVFSFMLTIDSIIMFINYRNNKITHHMKTLLTDGEEKYPLARVLIYIGTLFLYLIGFIYLGFIYSTPIIMIIVAYLLGMKNFLLTAISVIAFTLVLDYASLHFLQIMLPTGILFQ